MSPTSYRVIVVDGDRDDADEIEAMVRLLEYRTTIARDKADVLEQLVATDDVVAVLIADGSPELLATVLEELERNNCACACYLLAATDASAVATHPRIDGVIASPVSYKYILSCLHEAGLRKQSADGAQSNSGQRLARSLIGSSRQMQHIRKLVEQVAGSEASVLILGESGTGKEVIAKGIHAASARGKGPFVPVNCGAIPADLLESELFGHEKGAFTGAISSRQGRFEMAAGGTLFLDEIGDMPLNMQVKLLRVLQEHTYERVGSNRSMVADVRIVAATHQNLEQRVERGEFRMDLYYRLNVFPIEVPALRDRVEDIPLLARHFMHQIEVEQRGAVHLADETMLALMQYRWPGNVRELSNLVERLAILYPGITVAAADLPGKICQRRSPGAEVLPRDPLAGDPLNVEHPAARFAYNDAAPMGNPHSIALPVESASNLSGANQAGATQPDAAASYALESAAAQALHGEAPASRHLGGAGFSGLLPSEGVDLKAHLADLEHSMMVQALESSDWVVARAAKLLNLQRTTLVEKMRKFNISRPE